MFIESIVLALYTLINYDFMKSLFAFNCMLCFKLEQLTKTPVCVQ